MENRESRGANNPIVRFKRKCVTCGNPFRAGTGGALFRKSLCWKPLPCSALHDVVEWLKQHARSWHFQPGLHGAAEDYLSEI